MVRSFRVTTVTACGLLLVVLTFFGARSLASRQEWSAVLTSGALGAVAMLVIGSAAEWWVHGHIMHRRSRFPFARLAYELHHRAHHVTHYPPDAFHKDEVTYVPVLPLEPERACRTLAETTAAVLGQAIFYATFVGPPALFAAPITKNVTFTLSMATVAVALVGLAIHLHDSIHCPGHSPLERFRWFRWLDRHHYFHHVDTRVNVNLVLPLGDLLFGTLRRDLSSAELGRWPTYESASARGVGVGSRTCRG
jgi:hypothetical protein